MVPSVVERYAGGRDRKEASLGSCEEFAWLNGCLHVQVLTHSGRKDFSNCDASCHGPTEDQDEDAGRNRRHGGTAQVAMVRRLKP